MIDASIPLQTRPIQLDNPLEIQGRMMALNNLGMQGRIQQNQLLDTERVRREQKLLSEIYRSNIKPDGTPNHAGIVEGMATSGVGHLIPAYRKTMLDAEKDQAGIDKDKSQTAENQYKLQKQQLDARAGALHALLAKPDLTHQDAINSLVQLVQSGTVTEEQGSQAARSLPGSPEALRQHLMQQGLQVMDAAKRLDAMTPKFNEIDTGGQKILGTTDPMTGKFTPNSTIQKQVTPGDVLSAQTSTANNIRTVAESARGHNLQFKTANESLQETPTGIVIVNKQTGESRPAFGADGAAQLQQVNSPLVKAQKAFNQSAEAIKMAKNLLPEATGSGAGAMADKAAGFFGIGTGGAEAAASLEMIAGWLTSNVPRMEGPQSDKDTLQYRQMAAQIGDRTLPISVRSKALEDMEALQKRYAKFNHVTGPGAAPVSSAGVPPIPVLGKSDYDRVPSGAQYKDPQGNIRTKP